MDRQCRMWSCEDRLAPFVDVFRRSAEQAGYDVRIIAPQAEPRGFVELKRHYRHLSPNAERFELASFRRWFEIAQVVAPEERFVLADSDLVVQQPFAALPAELTGFDGVVGSIGATGDVLEDQINGGFSLWTGALLRDFCDYMVAAYAAGEGRLEAILARRIAQGNLRASISDMTLLYNWVHDTDRPFFNSNRLIVGGDGVVHYVDHNFFMPECLGARFRMTLGRKALRFARDGFWLTAEDGAPVRPASLHLGGRYKIMATDIERGSQIGMALRSAYILGGRLGRKMLQRAGR